MSHYNDGAGFNSGPGYTGEWGGKGGGKGFGKGKGGGGGKGFGCGKGKGKGVTAPVYTARDIRSQTIRRDNRPAPDEDCGVFDVDGSAGRQMRLIRDDAAAAPAAPPLPREDIGQPDAARHQTNVLLNYFPVEVDVRRPIHVYDVAFGACEHIETHQRSAKLRTFLVMRLLESLDPELGSAVVYEGGPTLFAARALPIPSGVCPLRDGSVVHVTFTSTAPMEWDRLTSNHQFIVTSAFQKALRKIPNRCRIGRVTYDLAPQPDIPLFEWEHPDYGPLRLIPGPTARLLATDVGPMLTIDISCRVKHELTVHELINRRFDYRQFEGRMGILRYCNRSFLIHDVTWSVKPTDFFDRKGTPTTYAAYAKQRYGKDMPRDWVPDLNQPMVVEYDKRREQTNYYLAECVYACGLADVMKRNHAFMKDLRERVGGNPSWRAWMTQHLVLPAETATEFWSVMTGVWGFRVTRDFTSVKADWYDLPEIAFRDKTVTPKEKGNWDVFDVQARENRQMAVPPPQGHNLYVVYEDPSGKTFFDEVNRKAAAMGMRFNVRQEQLRRDAANRAYLEAVQGSIDLDSDRNLVCVAMPMMDEKPRNLYAYVKGNVTLANGVVTQCALTSGKIDGAKCQMSAVQMCAKLGYIPWLPIGHSEGFPAAGTMVIGIDICHNKLKQLSLFGFVAVLDLQTMRCWHDVKETRADSPVLDTESLTASLTGALAAYHALHREPPCHVVVYRNGISETQLPTVVDAEVRVIRRELDAQVGDRAVALSVLLTYKDTKARLFESDERGAIRNPSPGTVVWGPEVSNRFGAREFLMVPHGVRQGCVMPLKLAILHNDARCLRLSSFFHLTLQLCCGYFNFFGAIKMPFVIQCAAKMAKFVGDHMPRDEIKRMAMNDLRHRMFYL